MYSNSPNVVFEMFSLSTLMYLVGPSIVSSEVVSSRGLFYFALEKFEDFDRVCQILTFYLPDNWLDVKLIGM